MAMEGSIDFHDDDSDNEAHQDDVMTFRQPPSFLLGRTKKRDDSTGNDLPCTSPAACPSGCNTPKGPNFSGKRKKRDEVNKIDLAILDELKRDKDGDDEDSHFVKSLIPH
eukprot:Seg12610.1 transcript_id=Seg12610.1/GoldUCD/mRNA.D3Y31 product="hypothetical protein" protein_id=Seg12610.1/GoldUCD/D3Y31